MLKSLILSSKNLIKKVYKKEIREIDIAVNFFQCQKKQVEFTFIDVGANQGQNLEALKKYVRKGLKIGYRGFEMVPDTFEILKGRASHTKIPDCMVYPYGLSDANKMTFIQKAPNSQWNSLSNKAWRGDRIDVELVTLDSCFNNLQINKNISVIKIDVEGHEMQCLHGMNDVLEGGAIKILFIEVGFNHEDLQHSYFMEIYNYLTGFGYRLADIFGIQSYRHPDWNDNYSIGYCNLMFVLEGF